MRKVNFEKEIKRCETLLKRELLSRFHPPIEPGFDLVVERLSILKSVYSDALKVLQAIERDTEAGGEKAEIESKLQLVKNGYIGIDRAIETILGIRDTLRLAPVNLSIERKANFNG